MQPVLAAALDYARRGWSVIPIRPQEKRPLIAWEPFQHKRAEPDQITAWFERTPDANIGVVTGAVSGLVVLDVDPRHEGEDSLAALEALHGALPHTIEALTGGGGRHVYFAHPGGSVRNRVGLASGIDLRGDGGIIVAPPSIHPSGRAYAWEVSHHPDDTALAPLPAWLAQMARDTEAQRGHPIAYWHRLVTQGVAEGERNNSIAALTGHLLWRGVDAKVALDLLLCWNAERCRPPLSADEVARTVASIEKLHSRRQ